MDSKPRRIGWLDLLKSYAIFLVFIGHKIENVHIEQFIYSFHIPLFFWISGFTYDQARYASLRSFLIRKLKTLIFPYFLFSSFSYFFWLIIVRSLSIRGQAISQDVLMPFWGIFYGVGIEPYRNPVDVALWFIPCLFIVELVFWVVSKHFRGTKKTVVVISIGICGYCTTTWVPFRLPWSADVALTALLFYYVGNLTRFVEVKLNSLHAGYKTVIICVLAITTVLLSEANGKADMNYNHYGNMIVFFGGAFTGIYFSYLLFSKFPVIRIISYVGQNTIMLVGLGGVSAFFIRGVHYLAFRSLIINGKTGIYETIITSLLEISILIPVMFIVNNYFPLIVGRVRHKEKS